MRGQSSATIRRSVFLWESFPVQLLGEVCHGHKKTVEAKRRMIVSDVHDGMSSRAVPKKHRVTLSTVQRSVARAGTLVLNEVDWASRAPGCRSAASRTKRGMEQEVLRLRKQLQSKSDLGEYGAAAIHRELLALGKANVPSVRTIGRILDRNGALDGLRRIRRQAPPPGWSLPEVASGRRDVDSFDIVEDLVIRGGQDVNVLTGIRLHGGLCAAWPLAQITAKTTVESLITHWREQDLPAHAKFDNDTVFHGPHVWPATFGRVTRLCLALGVIPIFAPPLTKGFQADIEAFNRRWQDAVWRRFIFRDLAEVQAQSTRIVAAHRLRHAVRIEDAPRRRPFPRRWKLDLQRPLKGRVILIRATDRKGRGKVLGHSFDVSPVWCHRLVRIEVDLTANWVRIHSLRRRDPASQPLLADFHYPARHKAFHD